MRVFTGIFISFICAFASAQDATLRQLTTPEYKEDVPGNYSEERVFYSQGIAKIDEEACAELKRTRAAIPRDLPRDEYLQELKKLKPLQEKCYVKVKKDDEGNLHGFEFVNDTKNAVNSREGKESGGTSRVFRFDFEQRERADMALRITDDSGLTGRLSHDLLETTILFIPRRVVPYISNQERDGKCARKVALPSNEFVWFDAVTKEIIGGVLEESPIDLNASRHRREFAGIEYKGNGIMIRADRRAGTPEHNYGVSYNVNERIKEATITHKGKTCHVPKDMIWANANDANKSAYFKYETDQEFLETVIKPLCGWDLNLEDII